MTSLLRELGRSQTIGATVLVLLAVFVTGWYVLTSPDQFPHTNGGLVVLVVLVAMAAAVMLLRDKAGGAWLLGLLLVAAVPLTLLLAIGFVPAGEAREGIRGLIYLYVAGAFGGLVLELLRDGVRGVIELPSVVATTESRTGPQWSFGFLARLIVGGLAGLALVTLIGTLSDSDGFLFTEGQPGATQPDGLVWALVAGSVAPAVWERLGKAVSGRSQAIRHIVVRLDEAEAHGAQPLSNADRAALTSALRELVR